MTGLLQSPVSVEDQPQTGGGDVHSVPPAVADTQQEDVISGDSQTPQSFVSGAEQDQPLHKLSTAEIEQKASFLERRALRLGSVAVNTPAKRWQVIARRNIL